MSSILKLDPTDPDSFGPPIRRGRLEARLAVDAGDLAAVLALRAQVFRGDSRADDSDDWDARCLHLRLGPLPEPGADRPPVWATLRVQPHPPGVIDGYAAAHYDLAALAATSGAALELGRLCLHPGHPDPDLMRLVWAGVTRLAERFGSARLIGCASFAGTDPDRVAPGLGLLAARHRGPAALSPGRRAPETRLLADWAGDAAPEGASMLPPLLRAYLALGGWVSDHLVIDRDLGTCHVLVCVEIDAMPEGRKRVLRALAGQGDPAD